METGIEVRYSLGTLAFLNFLRGMETRIGEGGEVHVAAFLNFLRGMETLGCKSV